MISPVVAGGGRKRLFPDDAALARLGGDAGACSGGLRIVRFWCRFPQVRAAGDDGLLHRVTQVLLQVKAVCHLDGIRCSLAGAL
jgi:hypothetical protein